MDINRLPRPEHPAQAEKAWARLKAGRPDLIILCDDNAARRLALRVIEKPEPPFWVGFLPMGLVFYAQKLKRYSTDLEDFAQNFLASRKLVLEAVMTSQKSANIVDLDMVLERVDDMPPPSRPPLHRLGRPSRRPLRSAPLRTWTESRGPGARGLRGQGRLPAPLRHAERTGVRLQHVPPSRGMPRISSTPSAK